MKPLILDPKIVLPWEHEHIRDHNKSLEERANEEKQMPRLIEEILADIKDYTSASDAERLRRRDDRETKGWKYVPPVPVIKAPADLEHLGKYIVYNGHCRRAASKRAGILLPCLLLEKTRDIGFLFLAKELVDIDAFFWGEKMYSYVRIKRIKEATWESARKYHKGQTGGF